jgi:hypothetical protein
MNICMLKLVLIRKSMTGRKFTGSSQRCWSMVSKGKGIFPPFEEDTPMAFAWRNYEKPESSQR